MLRLIYINLWLSRNHIILTHKSYPTCLIITGEITTTIFIFKINKIIIIRKLLLFPLILEENFISFREKCTFCSIQGKFWRNWHQILREIVKSGSTHYIMKFLSVVIKTYALLIRTRAIDVLLLLIIIKIRLLIKISIISLWLNVCWLTIFFG